MVWLLTINGADAQPRHMVFRVPIDRPSECPGIKVSPVNEVATLVYIRKNVPSIPVPQVYAFDGGDTLIGVPFFAMV
ncbi:uncharacterized protein H6S33_007791 [Morchella sextelata]|uniref:uncharacterized protein n=1 Tax=Morchella sextelata TaxID=1174677 RepID=UPI001D057880|nr:uncharacterized protein H6S33_007791 [Morchella sextelata]KAH0603469.1 hypothetical protein H6S33_007791 [Morchella sextelata]